MSEPVSIGLIGAGIMGERMLRAILAQSPELVRAAGIWDPSAEAMARIAGELARTARLSAERGLTATGSAARLETEVGTAEAEVARIVVDATLLVAADIPCETLGILSAAAGAASITVLWPAGSATERAAVPPMRRVMHVMKPVGGADLVEAVFARDHASLVTQAA